MDSLAQYAPMATFALLVGVFIVIVFQEAINGFHDTANAVATVIYSRSMEPMHSVVLAAVFNFFGVIIGGTAVAFAMVYLLPIQMVAGIDTLPEAVFLLGLALTAVTWNFATWYFGIPNSTTHTYIGAILGATLSYAWMHGLAVNSVVNWHEGQKVILTLIVSPVLGFFLAMGMFYLIRMLVRDPEMYKPGGGDTPPPLWIRSTLIGGAAGVSLLHGSNDGQKSIGLMTIALIGMAPAIYGFDRTLGAEDHARLLRSMETVAQVATKHQTDPQLGGQMLIMSKEARDVLAVLTEHPSGLSELEHDRAVEVRQELLDIHMVLGKMIKNANLMVQVGNDDADALEQARAELGEHLEHVPLWVILLSATALGIGTAIGYKRIVTTLGEKIGSTHMNAGQGTAAQLTAVACIGLADATGAPVSTTHVLSAGVAGTMVAGKAGLQSSTIRNILLTWVTTLPGTMAASFMVCSLFYLAATA